MELRRSRKNQLRMYCKIKEEDQNILRYIVSLTCLLISLGSKITCSGRSGFMIPVEKSRFKVTDKQKIEVTCSKVNNDVQKKYSIGQAIKSYPTSG